MSGAVFMGFIGAIFLGIGLYFRRKNQNLRAAMIRVPLEVIDMVSSRDSDGKSTYAPVYEIIAGAHRGRTHESTFSTSPAMHKTGDKVDGIFNPLTGEIASIKATNLANLVARIVIAIGTLIVGFALLGLLGLGPFG